MPHHLITTALSAFLHHHNHDGITADPGKLFIHGAAHLYGTPLNFCRFLGDYLYYEFDICHRWQRTSFIRCQQCDVRMQLPCFFCNDNRIGCTLPSRTENQQIIRSYYPISIYRMERPLAIKPLLPARRHTPVSHLMHHYLQFFLYYFYCSLRQLEHDES